MESTIKIIIKPYQLLNSDEWGVEVEEKIGSHTNLVSCRDRFHSEEQAIDTAKLFYQNKHSTKRVEFL